MPETTELKLIINDFENDCEKFRFMADEYLHDELSVEDKDFIEKHINECKDCFDFIDEEKKYLEEIKLAEYIPEISVSQFVMNKITEDKIIINKPQRKRFIPVGFITAAAVILIIFIASRGRLLNIFMKSSQDNGANDSAYAEFNLNNENIIYDEYILIEGNSDGGGNYGDIVDEAAEADIEMSAADFVRARSFDDNKAAGVMDSPEPEMGKDDSEELIAPVPAAFAIAEAIPEAEEEIYDPYSPTLENGLTPLITIEEFLDINPDLTFVLIYYPTERNRDFLNDIDIYSTDEFGRFDIIEKKYQEKLIENFIGDDLTIYVTGTKGIYDQIIDSGEYIAIIYF